MIRFTELIHQLGHRGLRRFLNFGPMRIGNGKRQRSFPFRAVRLTAFTRRAFFCHIEVSDRRWRGSAPAVRRMTRLREGDGTFRGGGGRGMAIFAVFLTVFLPVLLVLWVATLFFLSAVLVI